MSRRRRPRLGRAGIDASLVTRLLAQQQPQWSQLPVVPVANDGWDNRTYRLGDDMTVRLPTAAAYAPAIEKEHRWLPRLAPALPVAIPEPLALGEPGPAYPHPWSVRRWIDGATADRTRIGDPAAFADDVAAFLVALRAADAAGGPAAAAHSFWRGAPVAAYDAQTRDAIRALDGRIDTDGATAVWDTALATRWAGPPVWFHGDIAHGNLLVRDGALAAVIDFGTSGVGDPACDLVIAWNFFDGDSRETFRRGVGLDEDTWARARGWALWKALILLAGIDANRRDDAADLRVVETVIAEHRAR